MVNRYNITISNLLGKYTPVVKVTVRQRNHRPWLADESRMIRKKVLRLERIFVAVAPQSQSRDAWTSALRQSGR